MTESDAREKVVELVRRLSGSDMDISGSDQLIEDIGFVSLNFIELIVELEVVFDIVIPEGYLLPGALKSVDDLVRMVIMLYHP